MVRMIVAFVAVAIVAAGRAAAQTGYMESEAFITLVEYQLIDNGLDPGTPDGVFDERLRAAILAFQTREGLPQSGFIDDPLLDRLDALEIARKAENEEIARRVEAGPLGFYGIDGIDGSEGVVVRAIQRDTIADSVLGLQVGDEIVAVNGERVRTVQDVADRFGAVPPNVPVEVTITRNGEEQKLTGGPWFFAD